MSRLRDWWLTQRWPWWPDAMKVARDLDAEARATYTDDHAVGLGRVAPAPGESPATTDQVPVLLLEPRTAMVMTNPETGEVTGGELVAAAYGRRDRTARRPRRSMGALCGQVRAAMDQCGGQLGAGAGGVRGAVGGPGSAQPGKPPLRPGRAADGTTAGAMGGHCGCWVRTLDHTLAETQSPGPIGPCGNADSVRCRSVDSTQGSRRAHPYDDLAATAVRTSVSPGRCGPSVA
jgi:hypothetical protein